MKHESNIIGRNPLLSARERVAAMDRGDLADTAFHQFMQAAFPGYETRLKPQELSILALAFYVGSFNTAMSMISAEQLSMTPHQRMKRGKSLMQELQTFMIRAKLDFGG